ncbi:MAG: hypothetical protein N838_21375 [Thiohalocapsa sp. PB-PSB1]|jgi:hypothetical protein|nr:MAG: hypothetical protein N838_21375 [Thiohalocapsa sp. PB-PSB1]
MIRWLAQTSPLCSRTVGQGVQPVQRYLIGIGIGTGIGIGIGIRIRIVNS